MRMEVGGHVYNGKIFPTLSTHNPPDLPHMVGSPRQSSAVHILRRIVVQQLSQADTALPPSSLR